MQCWCIGFLPEGQGLVEGTSSMSNAWFATSFFNQAFSASSSLPPALFVAFGTRAYRMVSRCEFPADST
jgi:hypothetical protein